MQFTYARYHTLLDCSHLDVFPKNHFLESPHLSEMFIREKRYYMTDTCRIAIEHTHVDSSGPHKILVHRKRSRVISFVVRPYCQLSGQIWSESCCFRSERSTAHVCQNVVDELQVVHDFQRVPYHWHIHQDVAHTSYFVVLVHPGYLSGLLCRQCLIYADAVNP
jgi:hypothetical protein